MLFLYVLYYSVSFSIVKLLHSLVKSLAVNCMLLFFTNIHPQKLLTKKILTFTSICQKVFKVFKIVNLLLWTYMS